MKAHELAAILLQNPDFDVLVWNDRLQKYVSPVADAKDAVQYTLIEPETIADALKGVECK